MAFDFPSSPTFGQVFTANGIDYTWNGYAWAGGGFPAAGTGGGGLPGGGTTDQVLTKLSNADQDAGWLPPTGGGGPAYVHPTGDGNLHVPATGTANNNKVLTAGAVPGAISWQPAGTAGTGAGSVLIPDLVTLGGVGDGVTNCDAAFTAAEAHASRRIWVPPGTFYTTKTNLTKRYLGAGKVKVNTNPNDVYDDVAFVRTRIPPSLYHGGDTGRMHNSWTQIGTPANANIRNGWAVTVHADGGQTNAYFDAAVTPYHVIVDNYAGHPGKSAVLNLAANDGAMSVQVQSPGVEVVVGAKVRMWGSDTIGYSDYTVTSVTAAGGSNANIGLNRAVYGGPYPAIYAYLTISDRTMSAAYYTEYAHRGGGDAYVHTAQMVVSHKYNINAGQTYFMNTATGGLFGGALHGDGAGVFLTAYEVQYTQNPDYNIAVIHEPIAFDRDRDDGAHDGRWFGNLFKSPRMACDGAWVLDGNWKVGLDTVKGFHLRDGAEQPFAAVNMGADQRHYYNSVATQSNFGYYYNGNFFGDCYRKFDKTTATLQDYVGGTLSLVQGPISTFQKKVLVCEKDVEHRGRSYFQQDVSVYRTPAVNTGYIYLNQSETRLVGYDGTYYHMPGADLIVNGVVTTSDERLKENVRDMPGGLTVVDGLHPVVFDWINGKANDLGMIAQEVQAVAPEIVLDTGGDDHYLAVDYGKGVVMHLVLAVQQLSAKVAALEAQLVAKGQG